MYARRESWQQHLCIKNKSPFIQNVVKVVCVRESEKETMGCYEWHHQEIDIVRSLFLALLTGALLDRLFTAKVPPAPHLRADTYIRLLISDWLTAWLFLLSKVFPHDIFSGRPRVFPSCWIHVIHFCCDLFTLKYSCNILLRNSQLTCYQRSICNTTMSEIVPAGVKKKAMDYWRLMRRWVKISKFKGFKDVSYTWL